MLKNVFLTNNFQRSLLFIDYSSAKTIKTTNIRHFPGGIQINYGCKPNSDSNLSQRVPNHQLDKLELIIAQYHFSKSAKGLL